MSDSTREVIHQTIRRQLGVSPTEPLHSSMHLVNDLGMDELDHVEITMHLEKHLKKPISDTHALAWRTVGDVERSFQKSKHAGVLELETLQAFRDELEKIAASEKEMFEAGLHFIVHDAYKKGEVVGAKKGEKSPFVRRRGKLVDRPKKSKMKIAASAKLIGAGIGAGVAGVKGGLKEWDRRIAEERFPATLEKRKQQRNNRLKRLAAGVGIGAAGGALAGHFVGKGVSALEGRARQLTSHGGEVLDKSIDRLGSHYKEPFSPANAKELGKNLKEGLTPNAVSKAKGFLKKVKQVGKSNVKDLIRGRLTPGK